MKIAYLINQYPQSSQSFIRREIAALEELGAQVERFTIRRWDQALVDPDDRREQQKTRVVLEVGALRLLWAVIRTLFCAPGRFFPALLMAVRLGKKSDRGRLYHLIYLAEACVLLKWVRQCGAEHVHAHFGTNSTTVALLLWKLGGPGYSFTCHGPEEFDRPDQLKLAEKIRCSKFAVAISNFGRSQLFRWSSAQLWERIHVIHCGVDRSFLSQNWPQISDVPRLVCVGRLCEQKGQLLLIDAVARLKAEGTQFELALVGDGPMRRDIEKLMELHHLTDQVRITGWLSNEEVRREILASRCMILPSFAEGLPVVVMEALALGRPVISTYVAGIPELVESDLSGYLVAAGSVDQLTEAIRQVLAKRPAELAEMGRHGAQKVMAQHDARLEARKLLALFERAVGQECGSSDLEVSSDGVGSQVQPCDAVRS